MKIGLLLSQHARREPDKTAIVYGEKTLTFGAL